MTCRSDMDKELDEVMRIIVIGIVLMVLAGLLGLVAGYTLHYFV